MTAAGKIRYGDKSNRVRESGSDFLNPSKYSKSKGSRDAKGVLYTYSQNSKQPSRAYTMDFTKDNLNGRRTTLKPTGLAYENGELKYELKDQVGANMSEQTYERLFNSNYDDLSDDDLDTLYQLSGDKDVLKYRMQRTAKVVAAGKKYSESSMVSKLLQTAVAKIPDMPKTIEKGVKAVAKMVNNGLDTLKNNVTKAKEEREAKKAAEKAAEEAKKAAEEAKKAAEEAKKERMFNRAVASRAR